LCIELRLNAHIPEGQDLTSQVTLRRPKSPRSHRLGAGGGVVLGRRVWIFKQRWRGMLNGGVEQSEIGVLGMLSAGFVSYIRKYRGACYWGSDA